MNDAHVTKEIFEQAVRLTLSPSHLAMQMNRFQAEEPHLYFAVVRECRDILETVQESTGSEEAIEWIKYSLDLLAVRIFLAMRTATLMLWFDIEGMRQRLTGISPGDAEGHDPRRDQHLPEGGQSSSSPDEPFL